MLYKVTTDHFLSYGVVCSLQIEQHLGNNRLHVTTATHGIQQVDGTLADTYVTLSLAKPTM